MAGGAGIWSWSQEVPQPSSSAGVTLADPPAIAPDDQATKRNEGIRSKSKNILKWVTTTPRHTLGRRPLADENSANASGSSDAATPSPPQDLRSQSSVESFSSTVSSGEETGDSSDEEVAQSASNVPPFLYPLPSNAVEHLTVPPSPVSVYHSGTSTPSTYPRSGTETPRVLPRLNIPRGSMGFSMAMTPRTETAPESPYLNVSRRSSQHSSPRSADIPLTPSEISISRRSSMTGQPVAWVSTPRGSTGGANTPVPQGGSLYPSWTPRSSITPVPTSPALVSPLLQPLNLAQTSSSGDPEQANSTGSNHSRSGSLTLRQPEYVDEKDAEFVANVEQQDPNKLAERDGLLQRISESLHALGAGPSQIPTKPVYMPKSMLDSNFEFPPCKLSGNPLEDLGKEKLPCYSCTVHLEGFLPRKMEYDAPRKPSLNRSWQSVYFVIHGTLLHLYGVDLGQFYTENHSLADEWSLEKNDHVDITPRSLPLETEHGSDDDMQEPSKVPNISKPNTLHMVNFDKQPTSLEEALKRTHLWTYTLAGSECGYAADYTKRANVVRIRVQGEQFIVQARDSYHVVELIEALQASANICADLDARTLPKFLTLPRRRRRRQGVETIMLRTSPQRRPQVTTP